MTFFSRTAVVISLTCVWLSSSLLAQAPAPAAGQRGGRGGRGGRGAVEKPPSAPTPRFANGTVNLGAAPGMKGFWNVFTGTLIGKTGNNLPTNLALDEVPFQPWAKALYQYRVSTDSKDDPHARCAPDGGVHTWQLTNGLEIIQQPELNRIVIIAGHNHIWKVIHMEPGRVHPSPDVITLGYLGDSIGHWEGETLVIDTVGYNEKFWFHRNGLPHTSEMHLTERITRLDYNTLKYEATLDDPGAYTKPWSGGWTIPWQTSNYDGTGPGEIDEYYCMDNEKDSQHFR